MHAPAYRLTVKKTSAYASDAAQHSSDYPIAAMKKKMHSKRRSDYPFATFAAKEKKEIHTTTSCTKKTTIRSHRISGDRVRRPRP